MYAGLTKKNVQRGKWRLLTEREIRILKYLNSSIKGSAARAKDWAAAPAFETPEKQAPEKQAPARQAPAKQAPEKQAPAKQSPAKAPAAKTAAKPPKPANRATGKPEYRPGKDRPGASKRETNKPTLRPRKPKPRPEAE